MEKRQADGRNTGGSQLVFEADVKGGVGMRGESHSSFAS